MPNFAVNHMTIANASYQELLNIAGELCCVGVEIRNDLPGPLFDGASAESAAVAAQSKGLRILALSEITSFNNLSDEKLNQAQSLMKIAHACGAEAVSLIPRNDGQGIEKTVGKTDLRQALIALQPLLEAYDLVGMIEPLGFAESSLRYKSDVVDVIESLDATERFMLVHDTFHHHLAGENAFFPAQTGIVHVSGVVDSSLATDQLQDAHRVLVDESDCLDNIGQIEALLEGGYEGPFSYEAFSPEVHAFTDPRAELFGSFNHITSSLKASVMI